MTTYNEGFKEFRPSFDAGLSPMQRSLLCPYCGNEADKWRAGYNAARAAYFANK